MTGEKVTQTIVQISEKCLNTTLDSGGKEERENQFLFVHKSTQKPTN